MQHLFNGEDLYEAFIAGYNYKESIKFDIVSQLIDSYAVPTKAMTEDESYEWHKKHSRIDPKTGNMIISSDEIGDGTFEQKYKK